MQAGPKGFRATSDPDSTKRLAPEEIEVSIQTYQVGTRFKALCQGILMAPLDPIYTQVGFNSISVQVWLAFLPKLCSKLQVLSKLTWVTCVIRFTERRKTSSITIYKGFPNGFPFASQKSLRWPLFGLLGISCKCPYNWPVTSH